LENIISIVPVEGAVLVTFGLRNGETRTYSYTGANADLVLAGADPADLIGVRVR
jgi:hypothetical protein